LASRLSNKDAEPSMRTEQESLAITGDFFRPPASQWESLRNISSSVLVDADRNVRAIGSPLRAFAASPVFLGPALVVRAGSLAHWKALDLAQPGDVLMIATGQRRDLSEFGAIFVTLAKKKGLAAVVTDGLLRNADDIAAIGLPVFACGTHPSSPVDPAQGTIGHRINFAGIDVAQGDLVAGDRDGLAILPSALLPQIVESGRVQAKRDADLMQYAAEGDGTLPPKLLARLARVAITDLQ
jgi:4-hydroxy-4-methyl-2-oxoglutarate aldolase